MGRRALIVANLGLQPHATAATTWASSGLARALDTWEGPGLVVVAGNLLDLGAAPDPAAAASAALAAHPRLAGPSRRSRPATTAASSRIPGTDGRAVAPAARPVLESTRGRGRRPAAELHMATAAGRASSGSTLACRHTAPARAPHDPGGTDRRPTAPPRRWPGSGATFTLSPDPAAEWQDGLDRLADPASTPRFLTSRLLYRRFARFAWWLLVPFAIAIALRLPFVSSALDHLVFGHPAPSRAIQRAQAAAWGARLFFAALVSIAELVILAVVLGFVARKAWRTLGGGELDGLFDDALAAGGSTANDDGARRGPGPVRRGVSRGS